MSVADGGMHLDELLRRDAVVVVEPAAAVHHVALLQHAKARADDRGVREDEDAPAILGRVVLDGLLEPLQLLIINEHLVGGVPNGGSRRE